MSFFAFLIAVIALALDVGVFVSTRNRINDAAQAASPSDHSTAAHLSSALWITVGAVAALLAASFTVCCNCLGGGRDKSPCFGRDDRLLEKNGDGFADRDGV